MPLVVQPQTFTTDPPKSIQAKFYMKIITGLQTLNEAFFYILYQTKFFF